MNIMEIDNAFLVRMAQQLIGIASKVITVSQSDDLEDIKKIQDKHYEESMKIAKKIRKHAEKENPPEKPIDLSLSDDIQKKYDKSNFEIDMTEEKIEKGTACLPCSKEHLAVASGLLDEAARMAKRPDHGMNSPEVKSRVFKAMKEITNMERVDLAPDNTAQLQGKEKELADWAREKTAELRHGITSIKTPDDLLKVAALTSSAAEKLNSDVWDLTVSGGDVDKRVDDICRGLTGEALETCKQRVQDVISSRTK